MSQGSIIPLRNHIYFACGHEATSSTEYLLNHRPPQRWFCGTCRNYVAVIGWDRPALAEAVPSREGTGS